MVSNMDWMKIFLAIGIGAMILFMLPQAKRMLENSPKGSLQDWMGYIVPMAVVVVFIILLIKMV